MPVAGALLAAAAAAAAPCADRGGPVCDMVDPRQCDLLARECPRTCACCGQPGAPCKGCGPPLGPVTVATPVGAVRGATMLEPQSGVATAAFLGIPYAAPPQRFAAAGAAAEWGGVRDATRYGAACPQGATMGVLLERTSEDCLFANVFAPVSALNRSAGLPVLFFIHGGGFSVGSAYSQAMGEMFDAFNIEAIYDGQRLAGSGDVVVVSVNYRLGALGFLQYGGSPANLGLLDQVAGLRWARLVAGSFGGDAGKVTIFGESAGGASVFWHVASPLSAGLFRGAIAESGYLGTDSADAARGKAAALAAGLGCGGGDAAVAACMRNASVEAIVRASGSMGSYGPVVDPESLPADMRSLYAAGRINKVPLITGTNRDEAALGCPALLLVPVTDLVYEAYIAKRFQFSPRLTAEALALYPASAYPRPRDALVAVLSDSVFCASNRGAAELTVAAGVPTRRYMLARSAWFFRYASEHLFGKNESDYCLGVPHAADLVDVWGTFDALFNSTFAGRGEGDLALSQQVQRAWTNFAHSLDPNAGGPMGELHPAWAPQTAAADTTFVLDTDTASATVTSRNEPDLLARKCAVLTQAGPAAW